MTEHTRFLATGSVDGTIDDSARKISWIFSNEDVCLDYHTIATAGWDLGDFQRNPVLLFAHDQSQPSIGRVTRIETGGKLLVGDTVFADAETYPFADTIYRLIKGRFLNATSVSWFPLKWRAAKDKARPEGLDFLKQKLLEISVVPVPANPAALVTARATGIDTSPMHEWAERVLDTRQTLILPRREVEGIYRDTKVPTPRSRAAKDEKWKCGASTNLNLDEESDWDGPAAEKSVFEACGFDGDKPDSGKARKAFLAYDSANPSEKGSYKLPFAKMVDGRLVAVAAGIRAAASRLSQTDIPDAVQDKAREVIEHYEDKMGTETSRAVAVVTKRGLYEVANLAYMLGSLGWIKQSVDIEEAEEGDGDSKNPANMLAVLKVVGQALIDMAEEEVSELIEQFGPVEDIDEGAGGERALKGAKMRLLTRAGRKMSKDDAAELNGIQEHCARSARLVRTHIDNFRGKDLSDETERAAMLDNAEAVHDHCAASADKLRSYIDERAPEGAQDAGGGNPENEDGTDGTTRSAPKPAPAAPGAPAPATVTTAAQRRAEATTLRVRALLEQE